MKDRLSIFFIFFALVFSWNVLAAPSLLAISYDTAQIKDTKRATSPHSFGKIKSLAAHNNTAGEISTLSSFSCCNTICDSQEDAFEDARVEEFVQRHAGIFLTISDFIKISQSARTLIFPFHFFL